MASFLKRSSNKKIVSFDLWGTLIRSNPQFKKVRNQILLNHGYGFAELDTEKKIADAKMERYGKQLSRNSVYILAGINPTQGLLDEIDNAFVLHPPILMYEDLISDLINLKSNGYNITITSNTLMTLGSTLLKALPDLFAQFDNVCFSDVVGCAKPSSTIFMKSIGGLWEFGCQEIHVGDSFEADYDGALLCGMKPILVIDNNIEKIIKHEIFAL